jgi:glycosyltransferase involved in cell wall biosynthesis
MRLLGDRRPAIYCAHCWAATGRPARHWKTKLIARTEGWLCGLADVVVNVSSSDAETARRRGYRGTHIVVENAVGPASDTARDNVFSRDSEDEIHLLFVGRFDRQKGLDLLLPAFDEARQRNPDLRLHLVGGAVRDPGLPALPARAINHGWTLPDEIDSYYLSADALILPSRWEGMPLVALEALRNGTPVLASEPAALGDVLEDYEAGLTFQLSKARLTETLVRLNRATLREMRANARAGYAARFTQDRFVNGFSTVLADLAQARDV